MPMLRKNSGGSTPYTIAMVGENEATLNLYGEVVETRPIDWWTGEPLPGNYIAVDELLRDLEELNTKKHVTVHIHSVGGDFYGGLTIYNRLRTLDASITTINDGLAASAGSIIFLAGDRGQRKVYAGSNLMIHSVLVFLYGYYNANDLQAELEAIQAHNKAAVAAYVEATGLDQDTVKAAMSKDTYMTGQEAVDAGWADEVISSDGEKDAVVLSPDRQGMLVNGVAVAARCFGKLPEQIPQMTAEAWAAMVPRPNCTMQPALQADRTIDRNGGTHMDIKTVEELRGTFPELVAQVETAAQAAGARAERQRIQDVEEIQAAIGNPELVQAAKFGDKPMTAQEVAFEAMKAQASLGAHMLGKLEHDTQNSGVEAVEPTPTSAGEPGAGQEDARAEALLIGAIPQAWKKEEA